MIIQVRKKKGLHTIKAGDKGGTITPKMYIAEAKDYNVDGVYVGDYRGQTILNTRQYFTTEFDPSLRRWSFSGDEKELNRLIDEMRLVYPKGYDKEGTIIRSTDREASFRLTDINDPVFNNPELYSKYYMEEARASLDDNDPKMKFISMCLRAHPFVEDRHAEKRISKYVATGTRMELVSPKSELARKKLDADKEIEAITLFSHLQTNEDKMKAVCIAMSLPGYGPKSEYSGMFLLLKDAAQNSTFSKKYNKTVQEKFIELCKLSDDDIQIISDVLKAKSMSIIRARVGHYLMQGKKLDGLDNDSQLINYFKDPNNQADYIKLKELIENPT